MTDSGRSPSGRAGRASPEPASSLGHSATIPNAMSDESLVVYLNLSAKEAADIIPNLTPEKRAVFQRMAEVEIDLNMGIVPEGVMVCKPKGCRHD